MHTSTAGSAAGTQTQGGAVRTGTALLVLGQGEGRVHHLVVRIQEGRGGRLRSGLKRLLELGVAGRLGPLVLGPELRRDRSEQLPLLARLGRRLSRRLRAPDLSDVGIELEHGAEVLERIPLTRRLSEAFLRSTELLVGLHLVRVDDAREVRVGHDAARQAEILLDIRLLGQSSEDTVQLLKGRLRPDDKTSQVPARRQLEQVQAIHAGDLNSRNVAESLLNTVVATVDDEWPLALYVAAIPHLALATANLLGFLGVLDVIESFHGLEESDSILSLSDALDLVSHDKRNFLELADAVTTSQQKSRNS